MVQHLAPADRYHILAKPARCTGVVCCPLAGCIGPLVRPARVVVHLELHRTTHRR